MSGLPGGQWSGVILEMLPRAATGNTWPMTPIAAGTISTILDVYLPERARLIELLSSLDADQWALPLSARPTPCRASPPTSSATTSAC